MNNDLKLTIVVPIYNVEQYLEQCLDSLVNQSNHDFKVIMVDDGSKDKSGEIAQKYAEKFPERFFYVYKENAGLGAARNTGMEYCDTEYIEFLDSDDWLLPRTVELVLDRLEREVEKPEIVFMTPVVYDMSNCKFTEFADNEELRGIFEYTMVTNPQQSPKMFGLEASVNRCIWSMEFLKKYEFPFPTGVKWEDVAPHFYIFYWARRCIMVENVGFCYRINSGNQITSSSDAGRLDIIPVFSKTLVYAIENEWNENEISYILRMFFTFATWSMAVTKKENYGELVKKIHLYLKAVPKRYINIFIKQRELCRKEIILLRLLRSSLYKVICNYHRKEFITKAVVKIGKNIRRK